MRRLRHKQSGFERKMVRLKGREKATKEHRIMLVGVPIETLPFLELDPRLPFSFFTISFQNYIFYVYPTSLLKRKKKSWNNGAASKLDCLFWVLFQWPEHGISFPLLSCFFHLISLNEMYFWTFQNNIIIKVSTCYYLLS